jgi:ATP adenylyltransferase
MNMGAAGGAGIAEHLHLHAVPRWIGDTNFITVVGAARVLPRALEELWDELAPGFAGLPTADDAAAAAEGWSST